MAKNKKHIFSKKENGKNATGAPEKWTFDFCMNELDEMQKYLNSEDGSDLVFLSELCLYRGYSHQKWSEISNKFEKEKEIIDIIKKIEETLENRLYKAALTNQVNATMAIFGLKNKYKWKDVRQDSESPKDTKIIFEFGGTGLSIDDFEKKIEDVEPIKQLN
jgi:hypothetical protein